MLHILRLHADSGIFNRKAVGAHGLGHFVKLVQPYGNLAMIRRVLGGIVQDIDQYLLQPPLIAYDLGMKALLYMDGQGLAPLVKGNAHHPNHVLQQMVQVEFGFFQLHGAAFNLTHIQDFINQA